MEIVAGMRKDAPATGVRGGRRGRSARHAKRFCTATSDRASWPPLGMAVFRLTTEATFSPAPCQSARLNSPSIIRSVMARDIVFTRWPQEPVRGALEEWIA